MKIKIGSKELKRIVGEYLAKNHNVTIDKTQSCYHGEGTTENSEFGLISIEFTFTSKTNNVADKLPYDVIEDRRLEPEL